MLLCTILIVGLFLGYRICLCTFHIKELQMSNRIFHSLLTEQISLAEAKVQAQELSKSVMSPEL